MIDVVGKEIFYAECLLCRMIGIIISRLKRLYPTKLHASDPFKVLITTVLSQRTRDETTAIASEKLFLKYNTPEKLANADIKEIEKLIRNVGFYRVKAQRIKHIAMVIHEKFNDNVPEDIDTLLSLPGVGRKTANCVLIYGFGKDAVAVDTHVHRISNRLGLVNTKTPDETEMELCRILPKKHWLYVNHLLVRFGKEICKPIAPRCNVCPLSDVCKSFIY